MSGKRKNSNRDLQIDSNTAVAVHVYKKAKQAPPPPKLPTERLCLSALRWVGEPRIWNADGNAPVRYGAYVAVRRKGTDPAHYLFPSMWSAEHRAFVYKARRKSGLRFTYKRSSFIGTTGSSITYYGGIFGEADEQDPLFLVHRPILPDAKASAFKAVYDENWTDEERDENTPPFYFSTGGQDEVVSAVPESQVINLDMPDLRMHQAASKDGVDAENSEETEDLGLEQDAFSQTGAWSGNWSRKFIKLAGEHKPLEALEKVIWDYERVWGLKVKLEVVAGSVTSAHDVRSDEQEGKRRLESYKIRATVVEVYVSPAFFGMPDDSEAQASVNRETHMETATQQVHVVD